MDQSPKPVGSPFTLGIFSELLASLSERQPDAVLDFVDLAADEVLFRQGDAGDHMYVLLAGAVGVRLRHNDGTETVIDELAPGAVVGEMAILSGARRSATVYALVDSQLARLSGSALEGLGSEQQHQLVADSVPRWQRVQLAKSLTALFGDLDAASLKALQEQVDWQHLAAGEVLFRQGDTSDGMVVVINGRLIVAVLESTGESRVVDEIGPGQPVGGFALLTNEPRSATVYAARATNVARISNAMFDHLARQHPDLMRRLAGVIVTRLQQQLGHKQAQKSATRNVALVPSSPNVDTWQFAQELAGALARFGTAAALDAASFDTAINRPGAANTSLDDATYAAVTAWMEEFESDHQYILYVADHEPSQWTRRCIGQADRVLIVTDPRAAPEAGAAEQVLDEREMPVRTERVFWHPPATDRPRGTAGWLGVRQIDAHYHVRQGTTGHMERLARRLTGNAIALVLSGGSAYGFAYMGVYRAMLETGIPIDYVGGTSMGAIIGAGIAQEMPYGEFEDLAAFSGKLGVFDVTLPLAALTASDHMTRICQRGCGDLLIEDLWIPYFCVSTNLTSAEPMIHERGSLWRAARASAAIPGVFLPMAEDDNVLVDGAVMNNFPVDIMAERCETQHVIGGLVMPYREFKRQYDYDASLSGWTILLNWLNPFRKRLRAPSLLATLLRSMDINGQRLTKDQQGAVDLLILPNVKGFASSEFDKWKPLSEIGYDAAIEPLRKWKEKTGM